nr:hypothetical protein [Tanacetum cinerariifolium]
IQLQAEEFDLMAAAADLDEIEEVNAKLYFDGKSTASIDIGGTIEQHPANTEETCVLYDSLYHNLAVEVEKVNTSKSKNKGKVPTKMELVLEQTQQGSSYEVSISAEGVEESKRNVRIKGEKKEALHTLR